MGADEGLHQGGHITSDRLSAILAAGVSGAVAQSVTPIGGTTGTTDRVRLAVVWNDAGKSAGLPENVFIENTPLAAKNR